ncbi:hypothetical protein MB80_01535 [Salmonella enterica subsp. enterica serovar Enteritidis]|nr:hypothetical protein [Salmonella enterica subsp. enterica serovar Enteritidis]ECN4981296.1 hypothetical protein [Salmonella enterica subsp. enterica serovar Enteritidis]
MTQIEIKSVSIYTRDYLRCLIFQRQKIILLAKKMFITDQEKVELERLHNSSRDGRGRVILPRIVDTRLSE